MTAMCQAKHGRVCDEVCPRLAGCTPVYETMCDPVQMVCVGTWQIWGPAWADMCGCFCTPRMKCCPGIRAQARPQQLLWGTPLPHPRISTLMAMPLFLQQVPARGLTACGAGRRAEVLPVRTGVLSLPAPRWCCCGCGAEQVSGAGCGSPGWEHGEGSDQPRLPREVLTCLCSSQDPQGHILCDL